MRPPLWTLLMTRIEECWELLDEVQYLEVLSEALRQALVGEMNHNVAAMRRVNEMRDQVAQRDAELDVVREQLATEISLRTLGGTPPVSTPLWSNTNAKFDGPAPPPYSKDKSC